jgi:phosphomevalonate kinase
LLGLLLIVGGFLAVNYRYGLVSDGLLIGIAIAITTQVVEKYERRGMAQNAEPDKSGSHA